MTSIKEIRTRLGTGFGLGLASGMQGLFASLTQSSPVPGRRNRLILTANLLSFVVLCLVVFARQIPVVMFRYDGTFLLITAKNQQLWMGHGAALTMNFLEGNGGLWWAQINTLFDPALVIAHWLVNDTYVPVVAYTIYATEFFVATILLGVVLGLRLPIAVFGAWLGSVVSFPFFVPTLGTDLLWGNPHALTIISLMSIMVFALSRVRAGRYGMALAVGIALILIGAYICFEFAGGAIQVIPVAVLLALVCVWNSASSAERMMKIVLLAASGAILAAVFGQFLIGLYLDTKGGVFPDEMWPRPLGLTNVSSLLAPGGRVMSRVLWFFAICGAVIAGFFATRPIRAFAIGYLVLSALMALAIALIAVFVGDWWGPNPAYFDIYAYSLASLFSAVLAAVLLKLVEPPIGRQWKRLALSSALRKHVTFRNAVIVLAMVPWISLGWARHPYDNQNVLNGNPWRWPPQATAMTDYFQRQVGLVQGAPFRGRVANLAGSTFDKPLAFAPFASQHNYDQIPLVFSGNEHRIYGLLYFGIPILIESNHFSSPFFHLLTTRLLNDGPITSTHAQTALTKFDPRVLAAFGVRYVVTDYEPAVDVPLRLKLELVPSRTQFVYELERPNLGDYSPTRVHFLPDATAAIAKLASPLFDFSKEIVLTDAMASADLIPASKSEIKVFRDHLEISAESNGRSLLLLPVEFSHCLEINLYSGGAEPIEVHRANLEQTAIAFTNSLKGSIALRYGPITNSGCRLADYRDAARLKLSSVPRTGLDLAR